MMRLKVAWIVVTLILFPAMLIAQQEEVRVVKPYTPTLSGAQKIQLLPGMNEEIDFQPPEFDYQLYPKRYESQFRVQPIRAARMVKMPLKKLYKSQVTLGMGNYLTPLAELNLNQLRSRNGTFGLNIRHHSMNGKVKLENDMKAEAGFNENSLELYGDRFMKNAVLEYDLGSSYNSYVHYGVDPELDTVLDRKDAVEPYFTAEASLDLHSMNADSFHFDYNTGLDYYYFTHQFEEAEHGAMLHFDFHKKLRVIDLAGEAGGAWYGHYPDWDSIVGNHTLFWAKPYIGKSAPEWQFTAGVNIYGEVREQFLTLHFYPRASFEFNIVREVIVPYFGVDGYLESNNYRSVVEENPYVAPNLSVLPTSHKLIGYAGLKGRISDVFVYNLKGSYSIIDNQYFFVNDTSSVLKNQFNVVYDDITLLRLHGEFSIRPSDAWKLFLKGNYYSYTLVNEAHPWNKPAFDLSLQARYNMSDKILINMGVYTIGSRYYENFSSSSDATLPLTIDGNLGIEYRYTKLLSFWVRFNNVAAQRYFLYAQYPSYRFRAMVGLTYAL
ncbi:MAG: hypothetical protein ACWGNV_14555 [Bacteroidales bacterium]